MAGTKKTPRGTQKRGTATAARRTQPLSTSRPPATAAKTPVQPIVRRGALRRFDQLKKKTADLPVELTWDRRTQERRSEPDAVPRERRTGDRRRPPSSTWDLADFIVVDAGAGSSPSAGAPARQRKPKR